MRAMPSDPPNPWGSCFDATAHNLLANSEEPGVRVCHGIGTATRPGEEGMQIAHAWLEFDHESGRIALDCVWLRFVPAMKYRADMRAQNVVEYEPREFMALWKLHDFPGPWDQSIKRFTSESLSAVAQ